MIAETRNADGLVLRVGHTADWDPDELGKALQLLELVFDDLTAHDWEHALGGSHVLAYQDGQLIGHASLVQRRLLYRGQALRTGYVEGVAVHPAHQRRGVGGHMMDVLEGIVRRAFEVGALGASDEGARFYRKRGWLLWQGPLSALTPRGMSPTPEEEGAIFVLPGARELDLNEALSADWRDGDVW